MPKDSSMDNVVRDVLSASKDIVSSKIQKETLVASIHLEASKRGVRSEERDSHPFMDRLYKTQDGMTFYSYHDIYAYSHDLVSLDKPDKMLSVSSSELDEIERLLANDNTSEIEQDKLIKKHEDITRELNTILMEDKMNGHFHQPEDGYIRLSDDKVDGFRNKEMRSHNTDSNIKLSSPVPESPPGNLGKEKNFNKEISGSQRGQNRTNRNNNSRDLAAIHTASINPVGYAGTALGKFALSSIIAMGSGLEKAANFNMSKVPSKKRYFLSGLERKNHSIVSSAISENSLIMSELSSISNRDNLKREEVFSASKMLGELNSNLKDIGDKSTRGVLGDCDRNKAAEHAANINDSIKNLESSRLKEAMENEGMDFEGIMRSIKLMLQFISGHGKEDKPEPSPSP